MLAQIIDARDGARQSASQAWQQALADADHLAVLHAIWAEQTTPAREQRYRALLASALPPGTLQPSDKEQWLHSTLRAAELAGLDPAQVLARAVAERDLTGARDPAAVIDARIRRRHGGLLPLPAAAWSAQVPETSDPERAGFLAQLATVMDDRARRIGEHAAASRLPWAVTALGAVPDDPAARAAWQDKAAAIGTWRELSGHASPEDPVGPEPTANTADLRAAWHAAHAALSPEDIPDVRHMTDDERRLNAHELLSESGQSQGSGHESSMPDLAETSRRIEELATRHAAITAKIAERHSTPVAAEDCRPAFPLGTAHDMTAILQPPKPEIPASPWILERLARRDLDREAAD